MNVSVIIAFPERSNEEFNISTDYHVNQRFVFQGGQEGAKRALEEAVILPVLRPEVNHWIYAILNKRKRFSRFDFNRCSLVYVLQCAVFCYLDRLEMERLCW